jgi:hypothetical protein
MATIPAVVPRPSRASRAGSWATESSVTEWLAAWRKARSVQMTMTLFRTGANAGTANTRRALSTEVHRVVRP